MRRLPHIAYEKHPAYFCDKTISLSERMETYRNFSRYFLRSLRDYGRVKVSELKARARSKQLPALTGTDEQNLRMLRADGFTVFAAGSDVDRQLGALFNDDLQTLRRSRAALKPPRRHKDNSRIVKDSTKHQAVTELLELLGILPVASAYLGGKARVVTVACQINSVEDTSIWKGGFQNTELAYPPTSYMHIDSAMGVLKLIYYFQPTDDRNGAFRYVRGSHLLSRNPVDLAIRKANDKAGLESRSEKGRRRFSALPSFFRRKAAFGYDLPADSPESRELLKNEVILSSAQGRFILFDVNGVHRGAMVHEGDRAILQVSMRLF